MRSFFTLAGIALLLMSPSCSVAQQTLETGNGFELRFFMYNHAESIGEGGLLYVLTDSSIALHQGLYLDDWDSLLYSAPIPKGKITVTMLGALRLDTLRPYYNNSRVAGGSGDEYSLSCFIGASHASIHLHSIYHPSIAAALDIINSCLPMQFRYDYTRGGLHYGIRP